MIKILPYEQMILENSCSIEDFLIKDININKLLGNNYIFTNSGREAIRLIMEIENLKKDDEVFITTTTDTSFVSTCVSATIFNYSKISRVLTKKTKMIFVIHSFGFPHPNLLKLRKIADEKGLILVEDCAFALDSYDNDILLGSIGDYAIYSLSKIFPLKRGGMLISNKKDKNIKKYYKGIKILNVEKFFKFLDSFKRKRQENYKYLLQQFSFQQIYNFKKNINPFMFGFYHKKANIIYENLSYICEFGKTYVENEVHIPVNPFICKKDYDFIINKIKEIDEVY